MAKEDPSEQAGTSPAAIHEVQQINTQTADPGPFIPKDAWLDAEQRAKGVQDLIGGWLSAAVPLGLGAGILTWWSMAPRAEAAWLAQTASEAAQAASQAAEAASQEAQVAFQNAWADYLEALSESETYIETYARLMAEGMTHANAELSARFAEANAQRVWAQAAQTSAEVQEAAAAAAEEAEVATEAAAVVEEEAVAATAAAAPTAVEAAGMFAVIVPIVWAEMGLLGAFCHWMASDPPDPAFQEVYRPRGYGAPPVTVPGTVPVPLAAALGAALSSQLGSVSLCQAVLVSLERRQGAKDARDDAAISRQLAACLNYSGAAARALAGAARLLEDLAAAMRAWGQPDVAVTADQVRMGQQRFARYGLTDELLAVFAWLGVSAELLHDVILPGAISIDPEKAAGGYEEKLREAAALYRQISTVLTGSSPTEFRIGNPHDREETIDLFVRPVSMPQGWKVTIVSAQQAGSADGPEFPVRAIEPGRHYAVTLPAHRQIKLIAMLTPAGEVGVGATTRWAIEGKIGDELLGGVLHEMSGA